LLSRAVVAAVAGAPNEDVIDQECLISDVINTDALYELFQSYNLDTTLQFDADGTTATISADRLGNPDISIKSRRCRSIEEGRMNLTTARSTGTN
jgi:hypothetical protein